MTKQRPFGSIPRILANLLLLSGLMVLARAGEAPRLLKEIGISYTWSGSAPSHFVRLGARAVFFASIDELSRSWTVSDGTAAGTRVLKTFSLGPGFRIEQVAGGDNLAFCLIAVTGGFEIWKTDGSEVGTVRTFSSGELQFNPGYMPQMAMAGDQLIFSVLSGQSLALWRTDGTFGGTRKLRDFTYVGELSTVANQVYFSGGEATHGIEPWRTDGTSAGTVLIHDVDPLSSGGVARDSRPEAFTLSNGQVYFLAIREVDRIVKPEVWATDGSSAGTRFIYRSTIHDRLSGFATVGAETFFVAPHEETPGFQPIDGKLLATNGSMGNWREISGIFGRLAPRTLFGAAGNAVIYSPRGVQKTGASFSGGLVAIDPRTGVFIEFETDSPSDVKLQGQVLYYSMRPALGSPTLAARDMNDQWREKWSYATDSRNLTPINDRLFLASEGPDRSGGMEPWTATVNGMAPVKDLFPASVSFDYTDGPRAYLGSTPAPLAVRVAGRFIFTATSRINPIQLDLWASDGTEGGTEIILSKADPDPSAPITPGGSSHAYFLRKTAIATQLWATDATAAGTVQLYEWTNSAQGTPQDFRLIEARTGVFVALYRSLNQATTPELWFVNAVPGTAVRLEDWVVSGAAFDGIDTHIIAKVGFDKVWRRLGTSLGGSTVVKSFDANRVELFAVKGSVLASVQPWTSEGPGIWCLKQNGAAPVHLRSLPKNSQGPPVPLESTWGLKNSARFFFRWEEQGFGSELWTCDGTTSGTKRVADLTPGSAGSQFVAGAAVTFKGKLYFARAGVPGSDELWVTDGTAEGTRIALDPNPSGDSAPRNLAVGGDGKLYFTATGADGKRRLWVSDGNAAEVAFTDPGIRTDFGEPAEFFQHQDRLFFTMRALRPDGSHNGVEWWSLPAPAPADPFLEWLTQYGLQGADPAGDADGDGGSNFMEFAAGTIPTSAASASVPTVSLSPDGSSLLSFSRRNESVGISYRIETSENLLGWRTAFEIDGDGTPAPQQPMILVSRSGIAVETILLRLPPATPPLRITYFRLRVNR